MGAQWTVDPVEADEAAERDEREESVQDEPFDGDPMQIGEAFGDEGEGEEGEGQAESAATPAAEDETPGQEQPKGEAKDKVIPAYWDEEAKKQFAELPQDMQDIALAWEKNREAFISRKSQELSRATEKAAGGVQIMQMMERDPAFRAHVLGFGNQQQQEQQQQGIEQPPEDPLEFIEWKAKQAAMQELAPRIEQMQQQFTASQQKQRVDTAKALIQRDEHYTTVHQAIAQEVKDVAERFGEDEARRLYARLDADPDFYMRRYNALREGIVKAAQKPDVPGAMTATEVAGAMPKGRTVTERAPVLEGAGGSAQANESTARRREARKRVKAYKGSLTDIGELFGDPD
ncbi:hypothetical protein [uncultured Pseudodesulfovibrio sp.]|uniref:hypothetical protein n=1 Tax=uncultured Pseudodesulfovibrio sp. TaxID=2035858 RepID=UPI0029C96DD8|nr:hypothetical protein [uncultured Pseudodesulfovibrio sp.]